MRGRYSSSECERTIMEIMIQARIIPSSNSSEDQKKTGLHRNSGLFSAGNLWDLFMLTGPFLSDYPTLKSRWGDTKPRWGRR